MEVMQSDVYSTQAQIPVVIGALVFIQMDQLIAHHRVLWVCLSSSV